MDASYLTYLLSYVSKRDDGCWEWTGSKAPNGYGLFYERRVGVKGAHRVSYELHHGPIPPGKHVDHTCHDPESCAGGNTCPHRLCVNPDHLSIATPRANNKRSNSVSARNDEKTECPAGHPYDEANTYVDKTGRRHCRACRKARTQRWYDQQGGAEWHRNYHQTVRKSGK